MLDKIFNASIELVLSDTFKRTTSSKIRFLLTEIESAIEQGYRAIDIVQHLNSNGISLTKKTFDSCLYRLRKSNNNKEKPNKIKENDSKIEHKPEVSLLKSKVAREKLANEYFNTQKVDPIVQRYLDRWNTKKNEDYSGPLRQDKKEVNLSCGF